jgi:hypothetical protein
VDEFITPVSNNIANFCVALVLVEISTVTPFLIIRKSRLSESFDVGTPSRKFITPLLCQRIRYSGMKKKKGSVTCALQ